MNTSYLKKSLSHRTWLWWRIFGNFYRIRYGLDREQWESLKEKLNISAFLVLCHNENDLNQLLKIVKEVDCQKERFTEIIEDLRFCRPISWQYDFVKNVSELIGTDLLQTLEIDTLTDAYCLAHLNNLDTAKLIADLDCKYEAIFKSAVHKMDLLRRNFSLLLEVMVPHCYNDNNTGLSFREIVERYVSRLGIKGLIDVLKKAYTSETKLSVDENEVLTLAYYSPYLSDKFEGIAPQVPGCDIAACLAGKFVEETAYLEHLQEVVSQLDDDENDDNATDKIKEILAAKHCPVYFDPTERCLIDIQRTLPLYAHVYIEKFPQDDLNNSLPDFIQYKKGCFYTVEFVDDIKELAVAETLNQKLNAVKQEMLRLEKMCMENPGLSVNIAFRHKYAFLSNMYSQCFCIF